METESEWAPRMPHKCSSTKPDGMFGHVPTSQIITGLSLGVENSSSRLTQAANGDARSTPPHSQLSPDHNNLPTKPTYTSASHTATVVTDLREYQPEPWNFLTSAGTQENSLLHIY